MKCIVKDCINQTHEGLFIGELCAPCHEFVTTGNRVYSQVYKNTQRQWVGLTDEEVNQLYTQIQEQVDKHWTDGGTSMMFPTTLYKAFEAKLKEKNT